MDLKTADEWASWHPLTSLITFESQAQNGLQYLMPTLDGSGHYFSTLLHEITHLMSARFGRFGVWLARVAAREFRIWQANRDATLSLTENEHRMLGAFVPFLEGLALYTQLDYYAEEGEGPHYSPLFLVAGMSIQLHTMGAPVREKFRRWRDQSERGNDSRLLKLLLMDRSREDLNYYFYGYLYIKALQALWADRCPAFTAPSVFLPFAMKLLVEHPVILQVETGSPSTAEIVDALHETLTGLTSEELAWLAELFTTRRGLSEFDHCAIYDQLAARPATEIISYNENYFRPFIYPDEDTESNTWMGVFRACNAVYLYSWHAGKLRFPEARPFPSELQNVETPADILIIPPGADAPVLDGPGESTPIKIIPHGNIWISHWGKVIEQETDKSLRSMMVDVGNVLLRNEVDFYQEILKHEGRNVCFAGFMTMFRSIPGVAFWVDNQYVSSFISDPWDLLEMVRAEATDEMSLLGAGLRISPPDRLAFAQAFTDGGRIQSEVRAAGDSLLRLLASQTRARQLLRQRMRLVWRDNLSEAMRWAEEFPQATLSAPLLEEAEKIFDLPGFPVAGGRRIHFARLMPNA